MSPKIIFNFQNSGLGATLECMRHLVIVEEGLRDRRGHWCAYIEQVIRIHKETEDRVTVLAHQDLPADVQQELVGVAGPSKVEVIPFFQNSTWHRPEAAATDSHWKRRWWMLRHILRSAWKLRRWLKRHPGSTVFVTSVGLPQLITWRIVLSLLPQACYQRVILLLLSGPGRYPAGVLTFGPDAARWQRALLALKKWIITGKLVLAVENEAVAEELKGLAQVPARWMPTPMPGGFLPKGGKISERENTQVPYNQPDLLRSGALLRIASLGFARHERGTDLLLQAIPLIRQQLESHSLSIQFVLQWIDPFTDPEGRVYTLADARVALGPQDVLLSQALDGVKYLAELAQVDVMILPYRASSYRIRTSRLALECACTGIPMVCSEGTWAADAMQRWGAGATFQNQHAQDLARAVVQVVRELDSFRQKAKAQQSLARADFSDEAFLAALWSK